MKKKVFLFFIAMVFAFGANAQLNGETALIARGDGMSLTWPINIAANGSAVVGYINQSGHSFIWDKGNGLNQFDLGISASSAAAISNNNVIVGQFADSTYMYPEYDWDLEIDVYHPVVSAGFYRNGKWHSLGIKDNLELNYYTGSLAEAISTDGTIIGGSRYSDETMLEPTVWTISGDTILQIRELKFDKKGQGARIMAISGDGSVFGGWAAPNYTRVPVIWVNDSIRYITYNGVIANGEVFGISENGKYVALTIASLAAIYDIEEEELTIIGKKDGFASASASSVSNDKIVVGYNHVFQLDREGFIWKEDIGMYPIADYLTDLSIADVTGINNFNTPMSISADGSKLVGFGYDNSGFINGFYVEITNHIVKRNPPRNLAITEVASDEVSLSWLEPKADNNNVLSGYNVYRNKIKINSSLIPSTVYNYNDVSLANGTYNYEVIAVWNTNEESIPTNNAKINIGTLELPFLDDFSNVSLDAYYWNILPQSDRFVFDEIGNGVKPPYLVYTNPESNYTDYLISPYISTENVTNVYFSFNILIPQNWSGNIIDEQVTVEVFDGSTWNIVETFVPAADYTFFVPKKYDISQYAAGKKTRVRFVASGSGNGQFQWSFDNINVYTDGQELITEVPLYVTAHRTETGAVHVNWADPGKIVNLSYIPEDYYLGAINNEGEPFLAMVMYDAEDLTEFDGYKLSSISAHLTRWYETSTPVEYKLVVFEGTDRVLYQDIDSYTPNEWNTFELSTSLTIDASKPLYFGIEIGIHDIDDHPLGLHNGVMDYSSGDGVNLNDGRSNLISYDNGSTWHRLSEYTYTETDIVMLESLGIKAILKEDDNSVAKDKLIGYKIYRDGEDILGEQWDGSPSLVLLNNYTDIQATSDAVCYQVSAYYTTQEESEKSDNACADPHVGVTEQNTKDNITVYPNPANDMINITGNVKNVLVYDIRGVAVKNVSNQKQIDLKVLSSGIYFLKITDDNNQTTVKKIIKR